MPATPANGRLAAAISTGVVNVFFEHTGRGPTMARTTIDGETVVVILHDGMTKAERGLVAAGKDTEVLQLRRSFQETMRVDLVAVVERLTGSHRTGLHERQPHRPGHGCRDLPDEPQGRRSDGVGA